MTRLCPFLKCPIRPLSRGLGRERVDRPQPDLDPAVDGLVNADQFPAKATVFVALDGQLVEVFTTLVLAPGVLEATPSGRNPVGAEGLVCLVLAHLVSVPVSRGARGSSRAAKPARLA